MELDLDFADLKPVEAVVKNLNGKNYILREATADAVIRYRNIISRAYRVSSDGTPIGFTEGVHDADPVLIAGCMYEADGDLKLRVDKNGSPDPRCRVSESWVRALPDRVQVALFKKLESITPTLSRDTEDSLKEKISILQKQLDSTNSNDSKNGESEKNVSIDSQSATATGFA